MDYNFRGIVLYCLPDALISSLIQFASIMTIVVVFPGVSLTVDIKNQSHQHKKKETKKEIKVFNFNVPLMGIYNLLNVISVTQERIYESIL